MSDRPKYVWRSLGKTHGRTFWIVEGDTTNLHTGDSIDVTFADGHTESRVVRRVQRISAEFGQCIVCPKGTPPVRRIEPGSP